MEDKDKKKDGPNNDRDTRSISFQGRSEHVVIYTVIRRNFWLNSMFMNIIGI